MMNLTRSCLFASLVLTAACSDSGKQGDGGIEVHCDPVGPQPAVFAAGAGCLIKTITVESPCVVTDCLPGDGGLQSCDKSQVSVKPPEGRPEGGSATTECAVTIQAGTNAFETVARFEAKSQVCLIADAVGWFWGAANAEPVVVPCSPGDGGATDGAED